MKFIIKHEIKGRLRVRLAQEKMSSNQADALFYYLQGLGGIEKVKVYQATAGVAIFYKGTREAIITALRAFSYEDATPFGTEEHSRSINRKYRNKLMRKTALRLTGKWLIPQPIRVVFITLKACSYVAKGLKSLAREGLTVSVLDATAIGVSLIRRDFSTAASVMFLLGVGEILEEWTHKKTVQDLAESMSLNVDKVWLEKNGQRTLVPSSKILPGDNIVVHMGNLIPFDGRIKAGEATVNQASLTGESLAVNKGPGGYAYAGTVVEEGELTIEVKEASGASRYEKVIAMIENSEKLKAAAENKAGNIADKLVPYTFLGTGLTWLLTRNPTKTLAVLMVDFSCALKLAIPITVLSAIKECSSLGITVKGGKYLESLAQADVIVFDKTGTLTEARPKVQDVVPFCHSSADEML
ncbi:MAG: HAD-IC family P-type ATPase, partial [Bacillota bacterium]|nr:HAD-IC family P-type ATPase [Bacillota bacterium]